MPDVSILGQYLHFSFLQGPFKPIGLSVPNEALRDTLCGPMVVRLLVEELEVMELDSWFPLLKNLKMEVCEVFLLIRDCDGPLKNVFLASKF